MIQYIRCSKCNKLKSSDNFRKYMSGKRAGTYQSYCNECHKLSSRTWKHNTGRSVIVYKAKNTGAYLGTIAENVLSKSFKNVTRMPYGNPGYDFKCDKGFLIDVKSSTRHCNKGSAYWKFDIRFNKTPNYFIFLAFDSRELLNPVHVWVVPADIVNFKRQINICDNPNSLLKWIQYEKSLIMITDYCNALKQEPIWS